jgi:hypothetical protein
MVYGTPFLLDVIFKLEIGNWCKIGGYGTGPNWSSKISGSWIYLSTYCTFIVQNSYW